MSGNHGWSQARANAMRFLVPAMAAGSGDQLRLAELFDRLNLHHFGGTLPVVPVIRGIPNHPQRDTSYLALCHTKAVGGAKPEVVATIYIAERLFIDTFPDERTRWLEISRCLLHEMVHLAVDLDEYGGKFPDPIDDHGQEYANECNRISRAVGWDHVVGAEMATTDMEDATWWPLENACETCTAFLVLRNSGTATPVR